MLDQIIRQIQIIETYLSMDQTLSSREKEFLRDIVKLLKKTYRILPNGEKVSTITQRIKIFSIIRDNIKKRNESDLSSDYQKLLKSLLEWSISANCILQDIPDDQKGVRRVLSICQWQDEKKGIGQCHGYVLKWSKEMFIYRQWSEKKAIPMNLGIKEEFPCFFNSLSFRDIEETYCPIQFVGQYHQVPITQEIIDLQRKLYQFWRKETVIDYFRWAGNFELFQSTHYLADQLILLANNNINRLIEISLTNYIIKSHALGLIKTGDHYFHLMDSNWGYYRFPDATVFKEWFSKHFHKYSFVIHGAIVVPCSNDKKEDHHKTALDYFIYAVKPVYLFISCILSATVIISASIFLLMFKVILQPWNVYRFVKAKEVLNAEAVKIFDETWASLNNKHENDPLYSLPFFSPSFSEKNLSEIKAIPLQSSPKNNYCLRLFYPKQEEKIERHASMACHQADLTL